MSVRSATLISYYFVVSAGAVAGFSPLTGVEGNSGAATSILSVMSMSVADLRVLRIEVQTETTRMKVTRIHDVFSRMSAVCLTPSLVCRDEIAGHAFALSVLKKNDDAQKDCCNDDENR